METTTAMRTRAVTVKKLPAELDEPEARVFLREFEECLSGRRPAVVLDCSAVNGLGRDELWVMLRCLEEAMKRNGDVRLAKVSREARAALEDSGVTRLFKSYATSAEAIASFQQPMGYGIQPDCAQHSPVHAARNAA
jgi:anti-sigma B factor antagonist